uniref:Putative secreted protein n=1 Tax=Panstrongylus lignarius TaxID=156445 RepID=A0A224Y0U7_9HEMI
MKPTVFLTFQLLAVFFMLHCYAEAKVCLGCVQDADPNDHGIKKELVGLLAERNEDSDFIRIIKAQSQVVAGIRYILDFEVTDRRTNETKTCKTSFVSQAWLSKRTVEEFSCV